MDRVEVSFIGELHRLQLFRIVTFADVDDGPLLRLGQLDIGEDPVIDDPGDRKLSVLDLVVRVQWEQKLLPNLFGLLFGFAWQFVSAASTRSLASRF